MLKIAILSGKGGTGKTMLSAALADILPVKRIIADADVDAANLSILLEAKDTTSKPYFGLPCAVIDPDLCTGCGICAEACRFNAIIPNGDVYTVRPIKCEGCNVCVYVCPAEAASLVMKENGTLYLSQTPSGVLSHAELFAGSGTSGLLVTEVKKQAEANSEDSEVLIIDGPPGIGCPLIATVSGVDLVIIVAEPSLSSLHDIERLVTVCRQFNPVMTGVINKYDLSPETTEQIEKWYRQENISIIGKIPFDSEVLTSVRNCLPVTRQQSPASDAIRAIAGKVKDYLDEHE